MLQELIDKRMKALVGARRVQDEVNSETNPHGKGHWTAEQRQECDRYRNEVTELNGKIKELTDDDNRVKWLADQEAQNQEPANRRRTDPASHNPGSNPNDHGTARRVQMWDARRPHEEIPNLNRNHPTTRRLVLSGQRASSAYDRSFNRYLGGVRPEKAFDGFNQSVWLAGMDPQMTEGTIQSGDEERAGYFIASEEFMAGLLRNVDDDVFIQQIARVLTVKNARSLGIRKRVAKASAFNWGSELGDVTANLERSLKFGNRVLTPHYLTGAVRISRDLLRFATEDIQSLVMYEMGINLREILEQAFLFANGVQKPLGLFVPSSEGISTARDLNSTISTTGFTFDDWQKAKYSLKAQYRNKAKWMVHREILQSLALLRAANDGGTAGSFTYLWEPSRVAGEPDRILGLPYIESEWVPHTPGAGLYYAMLGDFSYYWIAYAMDLEVRRLDELAARTNEIEYHMRLKVDAMPILEEAFTRLAYKAS